MELASPVKQYTWSPLQPSEPSEKPPINSKFVEGSGIVLSKCVVFVCVVVVNEKVSPTLISSNPWLIQRIPKWEFVLIRQRRTMPLRAIII
jgi:hypothetical protein